MGKTKHKDFAQLTLDKVAGLSLSRNCEGLHLSIGRETAERKMNGLLNRASTFDGVVEGEAVRTWATIDYFEEQVITRGCFCFVLTDEGVIVSHDRNCGYFDVRFSRALDDEDFRLKNRWTEMIEPLKWFMSLPEEDLLDRV